MRVIRKVLIEDAVLVAPGKISRLIRKRRLFFFAEARPKGGVVHSGGLEVAGLRVAVEGCGGGVGGW